MRLLSWFQRRFPFLWTGPFVGLFSVAYTTMGGIVADISTDIMQLVVLAAGTLASVEFLGTYRNGVLWSFIPDGRQRVLIPQPETYCRFAIRD